MDKGVKGLKVDIVLDVKGESCPIPIVKTKKALERIRGRSGLRS